jgi:hypothetical protein
MTASMNPDTPPLLLSQNCRDGRHHLTGAEQCIGCDCVCHASSPTRLATLADWPEAAYWLTHRGGH